MQHEVYKEKAPNVIVDASGKLVSTEIRKGLDEDARKKILDYLHPPLMEKPMNQKPSLHQMEHYQKFYENGEYVRAVESTTEQNYNMIDGCANNLPKPRIINGRESVLDKLRIRQMAREKQKSSQEQSADMERICCCPDAEGSLQTGVGRNISGSLCGITKWFLEIQGRLKTENSARATIGLPPKGSLWWLFFA